MEANSPDTLGRRVHAVMTAHDGKVDPDSIRTAVCTSIHVLTMFSGTRQTVSQCRAALCRKIRAPARRFPVLGTHRQGQPVGSRRQCPPSAVRKVAVCLIGMWEYDSSPMRGAIMSPADVARLIADILDAAPPSLLADPGG